MPASGDEDVPRLDVAVHDAGVVCRGEGIGDLEGQRGYLVDRHRATRERLPQRAPLETLPDDEQPPFVLGDLGHGADRRMIECRGRPGLAAEAGDGRGIVRHVLGQELQRHSSAELQVLGKVDDAHPAATELGFDPVVAHDHAGRQCRHAAIVAVVPFLPTSLPPALPTTPDPVRRARIPAERAHC